MDLLNGWKIESTPYMDVFYKINTDLLSRFLAKYPNKQEQDFIEHKVYLLKDYKTIVCTPYTYSILMREKNGNSSTNFINNCITGITNLPSSDVS